VRLFRGESLTPAGSVDLRDDADNIRLDQRTGNLVVGYGGGGLAVIDPVKAALVSRAPLPAHPEGFQLDPERHRAIVNVPDANQIVVVDLEAHRQTGTWQTPDFRANFPMAFDPARAVATVVFRNPARLVLFDANEGQAVSTLTSCGDADDVFFDSKRRRVYVSCGAGSVDTWQQDGTGYRRLVSLTTASGARTSLFVPELDRLFVAARAGFFGLGSDAAILVVRPLD
jgi:hypothetical protein